MLEEVLLSLRSTGSVNLLGDSYRVKNMVSATNGEILKAKFLLVKIDDPAIYVNVDISTQIHRDLALSIKGAGVDEL